MAKLSDGTDGQGFLGSRWPEVKKILPPFSNESGLWDAIRARVPTPQPINMPFLQKEGKGTVHTDKQREARKVKQVEEMFNVSSSWDVGNGCSF